MLAWVYTGVMSSFFHVLRTNVIVIAITGENSMCRSNAQSLALSRRQKKEMSAKNVFRRFTHGYAFLAIA
jgi:hypothetical protein